VCLIMLVISHNVTKITKTRYKFIVEEIHSVGTINNVKTSYCTQLKHVIPNDNVSVSVGHLDHVLIVYSSVEHVT